MGIHILKERARSSKYKSSQKVGGNGNYIGKGGQEMVATELMGDEHDTKECSNFRFSLQ
jgi:hypothetical protein